MHSMGKICELHRRDGLRKVRGGKQRPCTLFVRLQTADLTGKTVLLTGSRIKIGYYIALSLLRSGATLIATSRFVVDAAARFKKEEDYGQWAPRLHLYRLDLRNLALVTAFCDHVCAKYGRLFAIVNNAAQTVRRPPAYYDPLLRREHLGTPEPLMAPDWTPNGAPGVVMSQSHPCKMLRSGFGQAM